ncbi:NADH-quinone oxidoreductase subunit N [Numidum massiliense]|uniref:NADH-quinone oxidoreductase subunit N n=1 Tax=Numidum massiliense TaxID=1522315 RepID=UPI0006D58162|nr:NADH-quinone oxidoreductase subunit N [Numidum massiliense]
MGAEKYLLAYDWTLLTPELSMIVAVTIMTLVDLFVGKTGRRLSPWIGLAGVVVAAAFVLSVLGREPYQILADTYRLDGFSKVFKLVILGGTFLVLLSSLSYGKKSHIPDRGEYYSLLLTAALGGMMMTSSADLITLYVGLELLSISSYILVGTRKHVLKAKEAAFKYFVLGGVASAFMLYGMSFVYGLTGTTNLYAISADLSRAAEDGYEFFVALSFILIVVGLGFKIAAAPFHMWAPDVYEGAPTPVTAFLAVVSKTAAFALLLRLVFVAYSGWMSAAADFGEGVYVMLLVLAALSMIVGNSVALRQRNVKRMMAYSSVAQAGYVLVPVAVIAFLSGQGEGGYIFLPTSLNAVSFYLVAYLFATVGAFAVIAAVNRDRDTEDISAFAGLYARAPWTALAMLTFVLSLAGIPITGGFFGKFYIFFSALSVQSYWIAVIMVAASVVSYFYYFEIVRQMFFRRAAVQEKFTLPVGLAIVVLIGAIGTLALGVIPQTALDYIGQLNVFELFFPTPNQ